MEELFEPICKIERGEGKMERQRRCKKDIIERHPARMSTVSAATARRPHCSATSRSSIAAAAWSRPRYTMTYLPNPISPRSPTARATSDRPEKGEESNIKREST